MNVRQPASLGPVALLGIALWAGSALAGPGKVYIADENGDTVTVLDAGSFARVTTILVGREPHNVQVAPDGKSARVTINSEAAKIQVYATPDSRLLFVANQGSKKAPGRTVSVIDLARLEVVKTLETGPGAHGVVVTMDGRYAFVTNTYGNTVSVIEVAGLKVVATVPVGKGPNGVSVTP